MPNKLLSVQDAVKYIMAMEETHPRLRLMKKRIVITGLESLSAIGRIPMSSGKAVWRRKPGSKESLTAGWITRISIRKSGLPFRDRLFRLRHRSHRGKTTRPIESHRHRMQFSSPGFGGLGVHQGGPEAKYLLHPFLGWGKGRRVHGTGLAGLSTFTSCYSYHLLMRPKGSPCQGPAPARESPCRRDPQTGPGQDALSRRFNPFAVSMTMPNACLRHDGIQVQPSPREQTTPPARRAPPELVAIGHGFKPLRSGELDVALVAAWST